MACTVYGLDVSNYQAEWTTTPEALLALIERIGLPISHIVIRAGLLCERPELRQIAAQQILAALALDLSYSLYGWGYGTYPAEQTLADMMSQWTDVPDWQGACPVPPVVYWADVEDTNLPPSYDWIIAFLQACVQSGITLYGVYTGLWWINQYLRGADLTGVWGWLADYDGDPSLDISSACGLVVVGHQYSDHAPTGEALDMDVFAPEAVQQAA